MQRRRRASTAGKVRQRARSLWLLQRAGGLCLLVWMTWAVGADAQESSAGDRLATRILEQVELDYDIRPDSITVGDPMTLEVRVTAPADFEVRFPERLRTPSNRVTVGDFELIAPESGTRDEQITQGDGRALWVGRYTLRIYEVGEVRLSPWPVMVRVDTTDVTANTDSIHVFIQSVLTDSLAAADIQDIKPQQSVEVPLPVWVYVVVAAVLVGAMVAWWMLRRRRRRARPVVVVPPKPAHEVALAALRRLEAQQLPLRGQIKQHYIQLSEILRGYLEDARAFAIPALEQTTHEIALALEVRSYPKDLIAQVVSMCDEADLVKFAKHQPTVQECMRSLEALRDFILSTSSRPPMPQLEPIRSAAGETAGTASGGTP